MRNDDVEALANEARKALERIKSIAPDSLKRPDLGEHLSFTKAEPLLRILLELYNQIPSADLAQLSKSAITKVKDAANADYTIVEQIEKFSVEQGNPKAARDALITQLDQAYDRAFEGTKDAISYFARKSIDFGTLDRQLRSAQQANKDLMAAQLAQSEEAKNEVLRILDDVRKAAAEQGVSQQAIHFRGQADRHAELAGLWLGRTVKCAVAFGLLAVASAILLALGLAEANNATSLIQFLAAKVLLFGTMGYAVSVCASNFSAHAHNEIVNRHRQNSLATFKSLADAASSSVDRDVVLAKAADSIFTPATSGFQKGESGDIVSISSLIGSLPSQIQK
ncbi:MAG: hypothetical protein R3B06_08025 [Kofleriaceae bacterium]